jgi:hypothetical protein
MLTRLKTHWRSFLWILVIGILVYVVITLQNETEASKDNTQANHELALSIAATAKAAYQDTCTGRSADRRSIIDYVNKIEANTLHSAQATISSPVATQEQKAVAQQNLDRIMAANEVLNSEFPALDCTYPPAAPTTTTTVQP